MSKQYYYDELLPLAKEIRATKLKVKNAHREGDFSYKISRLQGSIPELQSEYRHKHIAYSLMRGRKLEQIEKPREGNEPDMPTIESYMGKIAPKEVLYVFVRQDLSLAQQAVQSGHAIAVASNAERRKGWTPEDGTIVILAVDDENHLKEVKKSFNRGWHEFREPDIGNELTAIATYETKGYFWQFHTAKFMRKCCGFFKRILLLE